jgi:hypothetical protein
VPSPLSGLVHHRDRIVEDSRPLLEPGELVAHVVRALEGPPRLVGMLVSLAVGVGASVVVGPLLSFPLMFLAFTAQYRRRVILATDRSVTILGCAPLRFVPRRVLDRLDVDTRLGPPKGLFFRIAPGGRKLYVVPRCVQELQEADQDVLDA